MKKPDNSKTAQVQQPDISQLPQTRPLINIPTPAKTSQQAEPEQEAIPTPIQQLDISQLPQTRPLVNIPVPAVQPSQQRERAPELAQKDSQPENTAQPEPLKVIKTDPSEWDVMIIDDEPDNVGVARLILEFNKSIVRSALSGTLGLEMLRENRDNLPTFLLLDIQMPKMSGWDVLKIIRDDPAMKHLPVIALTAHAMVGDKERILAGGFDGYISKPVSPVTFIEQIKDVLGSRQST